MIFKLKDIDSGKVLPKLRESYPLGSGMNEYINGFNDRCTEEDSIGVEIDEKMLYNFILSLGGDLQFAYIYKGQEGGDPARDVAKAISQNPKIIKLVRVK